MLSDKKELITIDNLIVNNYYKLQLTGEYLGRLIIEPEIFGSGDGREMNATFLDDGKYRMVPRWYNYGENKLNYFLLVNNNNNNTVCFSTNTTSQALNGTKN